MNLSLILAFLMVPGISAVAQVNNVTVIVPQGHTNEIESFDISPDGKYIVTGGYDQGVIIWDVKTGVPFKKIDKVGDAVQQVFFVDSEDRLLIVKAKDDLGAISPVLYELWDISSGEMIERFPFDASAKAVFSQSTGQLLVFGMSPTKYPTDLFLRSNTFLSINDLMSWDINRNEATATFPFYEDAGYYMEDRGDFKFLNGGRSFVAFMRNFFEESKVSLFAVPHAGSGNSLNEPLNTVDIQGQAVALASFPDRPMFAVATKNDLQIWELGHLNSMTLVKKFPLEKKMVNSIEIGAKGRILMNYTERGKSFVECIDYDSEKTMLSMELPFNDLDNVQIKISPDNSYFVSVREREGFVYSMTGRLLFQLNSVTLPVFSAFFSPDGRHVFSHHGGNYWEAALDFYAQTLYADPELGTGSSETSKDQTHDLLTAFERNKNKIKKWDLATGKSYFAPNLPFEAFTDTISPQGHALVRDAKNSGMAAIYYPVVAEIDNFLIGEPDSIKASEHLKGVVSAIMDDLSSPSGFMKKSYGPKLQLVLPNQKDSLQMIAFDEEDWIILCQDGYYLSSVNGAKRLSYLYGDNIYPFEQFDLQFNRPDIVLSRIGLSDTTLISSYHFAYQKRLSVLNIDSTQFESKINFNVPELTVVNKNEIQQNSQVDFVDFEIKVIDERSKVSRILVWNNGVPVYGKEGIAISNSGREVQEEIQIKLHAGKNLIEFSALNQHGVESLREAVDIFYENNSATKPNLYLITIGVDKYKSKQQNLKFVEKDLRSIHSTFTSNTPSGIGEVIEKTFYNRDATLENILAYKKTLQESKEEDFVFVFYSGHGILSKNQYYLGTSEMDFKDPKINGIPFDELENLLDKIPARNKAMFIDACYSGEQDNEILTAIERRTATIDDGTKLTDFARNDGNADLVNFSQSFWVMKEMFPDLRRGNGTTVLAASAGNSLAKESKLLQRGYFTYSVLEGIHNMQADNNGDGIVSIKELEIFVKNKVRELTDNQQIPTYRIENSLNNFAFWTK